MVRRYRWLPALFALLPALAGCGEEKSPVRPPVAQGPSPDTLRAAIAAFKLAPLPAIPYPRNNPQNVARITLGRLLFFDPILGGESAPWVKRAAGHDPYRYRASDVACATCHQPQFGFADNRPLAAGVGGGAGETHPVGEGRVAPARSLVTGQPVGAVPRNSMTILNTGLNGRNSIVSTAQSFQFMDGLTGNGLEFQCFFPLVNREEMVGDAFGRPEFGTDLTETAIMDSLGQRVRGIPQYVELFKQGFPTQVHDAEDVRSDMIFLTIAAYERELVTPGARYDAFVAGDFEALTLAEQRGFLTFFGKAKCGSCHRGPMLSDYSFRCQGTGDAYDRVIPGFAGKNGQGGDWGRFHGLGPNDPNRQFARYLFRVVSLRNVDQTPPYFHSGSARTLREAVEFYNRGGLGPEDIPDATLVEAGTARDPAIVPLGLTDMEIDDLVAFMKTLTGTVPPGPGGLDLAHGPERVWSGLLPPGVPTPAGSGPFYPEPVTPAAPAIQAVPAAPAAGGSPRSTPASRR